MTQRHLLTLWWGFVFLVAAAIFGHSVNDQNGAWKMVVIMATPTLLSCWLIGWANKWQRITAGLSMVAVCMLMHVAAMGPHPSEGGFPAVAASLYDTARRWVKDLPPAPPPPLKESIKLVPINHGDET